MPQNKSRRVVAVKANDDWTLEVSFSSNEVRLFDVKPLLTCEAFAPLQELAEFKRLRNGGYYIEWESGADLSGDTLFLDGSPSRSPKPPPS